MRIARRIPRMISRQIARERGVRIADELRGLREHRRDRLRSRTARVTAARR
jgi:hypothetical protein